MLGYGYELKNRNDNYQGWKLVLKHGSGYGSGLGSANRIGFEGFVNRYAKSRLSYWQEIFLLANAVRNVG